MKLTIAKLGLAACGLALCLLNPLSVKGQEYPFFKNGDGRVTFLRDANPGGNYLQEECPVKLGDKTALLDIPTFKIQGQLWDLVGELVQVYYGKYALGNRLVIPVSAAQIMVLSEMTNVPGGVAYIEIRRTPNGASQATLTEPEVGSNLDKEKQKHYELVVSSDLFDQIAITSEFGMEIVFRNSPGNGCVVRRAYPGILGKTGEWGWDVPGSPDWSEAFYGQNHDAATNSWLHLKTEPNYSVEAKVTDLAISLGGFMTALRAVNPDAAAKLDAAMNGGKVLTARPEQGLAAMREAAHNVANALDTGKPLPEDVRKSAAQAVEQARTDSPKMKEMAERLDKVLKLGGDVNSLGMKFVNVPGTSVKFCIWDVRVQDYRAYAEANAGADASWKNPGFAQGDTHPVVKVSWNDAKAFCDWLSRKEGKTYRLPTDAEWSVAVGLQGESGSSPAEKDGKIEGVYPWGAQWPPPNGAGNYAAGLGVDNFANTSPVGSFAANQFGLYDMGGNVWQWCEDWYDSDQRYRVLRGASWYYIDPGRLLSSCRGINTPGDRYSFIGFRVVLGGASSR